MFQKFTVFTLSASSFPQEYLTNCMALPTYHVIAHEAHANVAQMCFRYISVLLKQKSSYGSVAALEFFPMLSYVLSCGFNHIAYVDPESIVILEALQFLGSDIRHHPSHWDRLCELREEDLRWPYPPWPSSRHDFVLNILIAYSSPALLEAFLSGRSPLKPRVGTNPLVYAADLRKTKHAMVLLACGADMNMHGMVVDDSHKALPLDVAIDLGDDVLVGELLQRGCVVTSEVLSTAVCMPWCSSQVLAKLMETNEFVGWANEIADEKLYRGIFNSARPNAGDSRKADEDHVALARRLRQIGQELSADSPFGAELIERAVHAAHTSMLEYLLPPDQPPPPRFLFAVSTGDTSETVSVLRFLLRKGVDINAVSDGSGDTALHLAAMCPWEPRSLELTQMLINAGCNVHAHNLLGETPLTVAVQHGYLSVVEHLLSYGVLFPSNILPTALRLCSTPRMVEFLIHKGVDMNSTTSDGDTVLHLAAAKYAEPTCLDLINRLLKAGCNPTTLNSEGNTVLDVAIERGYTSVVERLLSRNVPFLPSILPTALGSGTTPQMVEFLIQKGADVHSTTSNGDTVLHLAVAKYPPLTCLHLVKRFIEAGFDATTCNSEGKTVLEAAIQRGYASVVEHLLLCNISLPPNILPTMLQNHSFPHMVEFLIRKGADVHSTASNGDTVLHLAIAKYAEQTCLDLVKRFIKAGFNATACNSKGKTVLDVAIERGYTSVVEHLLSRNVPSPPSILPTALQNRSTPRMVELLIRKGADVHSTTSDGDTLLHLAVAKYPPLTCLHLVKILVDAGCNPMAHDSKAETVLEAVMKRGYASVMQYLLSCNVPLPPAFDFLSKALLQCCIPQIVVQLLAHQSANDLAVMTESHWNILHQLARASYIGPDRQWVIEFLNARQRQTAHVRDETSIGLENLPSLR